MMSKDRDQLDEISEEVFELKELVEYQPGSVVSRTLVDKETVTLTLFAFDERQSLSEHTSPHTALLQVLEGAVKVTIEGEEYELHGGEAIVMPADVPHAIEAVEKFKMFLTMVKSFDSLNPQRQSVATGRSVPFFQLITEVGSIIFFPVKYRLTR